MYFSSFRPLLSYSRFFLQEEKRTLHHLFSQPEIYLHQLNSNSHNMYNHHNLFPLEGAICTQNIQNASISQKQESLSAYQPNRIENRIEIATYEANKLSEDRLIGSQLEGIEGYMISVFDGHNGSHMADYCSAKMTEFLEQFFHQHSQTLPHDKLITQGLKWAYHQIETNFYEDIYLEQLKLRNRKIKTVGTCALTLIISNNKVYVANCGDSQAIIIQQKDHLIEYKNLNEKLSANNPHERQRLRAQFPSQEDIVIQEGKGCYYVKGRLQPTRTLGDYHMKKLSHWYGKTPFTKPYILSEPQINVFEFDRSHSVIVVGSDGIWDFIDKWSVSRLALEQNPHERILEETIKKIASMNKMSEQLLRALTPGERRDYHDDISLAVVNLSEQFSQW